MTDVREDILARLLEVLSGVPGIRFAEAQRNNVDIPEELLPAIIVFDGDEETNGGDDRSARPANRPYVARMTPEVIVAEQTVGQVGAELNVLRREIIKRVLNDAGLIAQVGGNGNIRYLGCQTDVGWMRSLHGAMSLLFSFQYSLKIEEL